MTRADALRDLAERLAECNGAVRVISTVLGTAAIAAAEMADGDVDDLPAPALARPETIPVRYAAKMDAGAFVIASQRGDPIAFAETQAAAERVAVALNMLAAIEDQEAQNAA